MYGFNGLYRCDKEKGDENAEKLIQGYRKAATHYAKIRPVIESFDGKIFNVRLQRALQP